MTDGVGNSYYLASSTAKLMVSRKLQQSMTEDYEPSEGAYAKAYLDHGIKPEGNSYQYVVIPDDSDGTKLDELASDPSAYYEVLDSSSMHLVRFPRQSMTAYAFFEAVETPEDELIRSVDQPAALIVQELEEDGTGAQAETLGETGDEEQEETASAVRLAASVPDIGWQFENTIVSRGHSYTRRRFAFQRAKAHTLRLTLRGTWCPDEATAPVETESVALFGETLLQLQCRDGLSTEVRLDPCGVDETESQGTPVTTP